MGSASLISRAQSADVPQEQPVGVHLRHIAGQFGRDDARSALAEQRPVIEDVLEIACGIQSNIRNAAESAAYVVALVTRVPEVDAAPAAAASVVG